MQRLSDKQNELLNVIAKGNGENNPADLDEVLERVRYDTSKQSLQFSIRSLITRGLIEKKGIEKRRGRHRQVLQATELGHSTVTWMNQEPTVAVVSSIEDDEFDLASFA